MGSSGLAFLLTACAGLATLVGSFLGLAIRKPGKRFMGFTLGFSAGVMTLVAFVELLQHGISSIGFMRAHIGFFCGMIFFFLIDFTIPHEYMGERDHSVTSDTRRLHHAGFMVALGIVIHNFPEGMSTFASTLEDKHLGFAIAAAIAIHNIPEGLAVSSPIYVSTGSRKKAFLWSFLSGLSEPVGAGLAAVFFLPFLNKTTLGWLLSVVGGIMVAISVDELVPSAKAFGSEHLPLVGIITGMMVMALSLWLLGQV